MSDDERYVEYMPLPEIRKAARNPKRHDVANIRASLTRFGLAELPLIDERTGALVAGHGRIADLEARQREGEPPPRGVRVDENGNWLVPVQRGWASTGDAEADAYIVASNRLAEIGGWDDRGLAELLSAQGNLDGLGFDQDQLDELIKATDLYGDSATAFLDDLLDGEEGEGDDDEPLEDVEPGEPAGRTGPPPVKPGGTVIDESGVTWVTVSWTATVEQRDLIREAISAAQQRLDLSTSIEALTAICDHYLRSTR